MHAIAVKVATGSLSGFLRIFQVRHRDYRPEDLLLEQELEQAILQLELGRFSAWVCRALHSKSLYEICNSDTCFCLTLLTPGIL